MANQSRIPHAQPSEDHRRLQRERDLAAAEALQEDLYKVLDEIRLTVERLSSEHNKSEAFILEQLHLGGAVLRQKRSVGINNAYAHCEARCDDIWKHDDSKKEIREVIAKAKTLGGYEHLEKSEKDVLITGLEATRTAHDTGIVRRPMAQMHDVRVVCERVCRELLNIHFRDEVEAILLIVKSNPKHHSKPVVLLTPKAETFFGTIVGQEPQAFMTQFEAFAINGIAGVFKTHEDRRNFMKGYISKTLTEQIELLSGGKCRLEYAHFEKRIAEAKGIIITGWTYPEFVSPSYFKKLADIQTLYNAIRSGDCKAVKLSQQEWDDRVAASASLAALAEHLPADSAAAAPASKKRKALDVREEEQEGEEEQEEREPSDT